MAEKEFTPYQELMDVVYRRIGFSKRDASRLGKAMKDFAADKVLPGEVEAYFDWYLSSPWRRENQPMTIQQFLAVEGGCLSWIPGYRKNLVFNLAHLQSMTGPYIHRPDLRNLELPLEHVPDSSNWSFAGLQVAWYREAWMFLWYVIANREHPPASEMVHQSYGVAYVEKILQEALTSDRKSVWRRINQVLGMFANSVYYWQMRSATPDAPFVAEAVQIIANKQYRILRPIDTTGAMAVVKGSDLI